MDDAVRTAALAYAERHYAEADLVVVGGSASGVRRLRSDIDLLVIGPPTMFQCGRLSAAHTDLEDGELFEVFAATPEEYRRRVLAAAARFRPVTGHLLVDGEIVINRGTTRALVTEITALVAAGPTPSPADLDQRRYGVSSALDDLLDAEGSIETAVLAGQLFQRLGEFVLLASGRWIGTGRWLLRRLDQLDPELTAALGTALAERDVRALADLTEKLLAPFGGRLQEGHVR